MNGLYDLRYRDPKEELPPDNTVNTLLKLLSTTQKSNALLKYAANPNLSFKNFEVPTTEPVVAPIPSETPPVVTPVASETPSTNAVLNAPAPVTKKPANALLDYWSQPVVGKIPLDRFVQMAGMVSHLLAPEEPMGRLGAGLAQMGGVAYAERMKEPENALRRRLLEAQITEAETPKEWGAFSKSLRGTIDSETGKLFTEAKILQKYHELSRVPEKRTPHYVSTIQKVNGIDTFGTFDTTSKTFTPIREATPKDIEDVKTGKIEEAKAPTLDFEYKNINGIPHKRQTVWDSATKQRVPKGDWIRIEKPQGAGKEATPIQYWGVISKIEDDARSYANVTVPKAAGGITFGQGGTITIGGGIAKEDVDKWVNAYKSHYSRKVDEAKRMKALPKDYATEIAPEIFKDTQGREIVKDSSSSTGWRYKELSLSGGKSVPPPSPVPTQVPPTKKQEPKAKTGNTIQDVVKAGGKAVKMKDGSTHVFDKDGNYVGTAK